MILPPYAETLGARVAQDADGLFVVMPYSDDLLGRPGFIHGGAIAGLLEIAAHVALREAVGEEDRPRIKPVTVTVDFRRGGRQIETRASGSVTRLGNRIANVDAVAWQDDRSKPIATARMNVLLDREARRP